MDESKGQAMLLTVILLSGLVLASTSLAGLLILYQLRQATDTVNSMNAIFAADAGLEWAFYNETRTTPQIYPHVINLSNGGKVTITYNSSDPLPIRVVGQYGRSARAFQASSPVGGESKLDVMLVLDRSGSIDDIEEDTMLSAAKSFVDAISPSAASKHMGVVDFSYYGSLRLHLTGDATAVKAVLVKDGINGSTNLYDGIRITNGELDDTNIPYERPGIKDIMVLITDGQPNTCGTVTNWFSCTTQQAEDDSAAQADAARAAGVEIYVIGVGVDAHSTDFLTNRIADNAVHYYSVADFSGLEDIMKSVARAILSTKEVTP